MAKYVFELETIDYTPSIITDIKQEVQREREQAAALKQNNKDVSAKLLEVIKVITTDLKQALGTLGLPIETPIIDEEVNYTHRVIINKSPNVDTRTADAYLPRPFVKIECPTQDGKYKFEPKIYKCILFRDGSWTSKGEYKGVEDFVNTFRDEIQNLYRVSLKSYYFD